MIKCSKVNSNITFELSKPRATDISQCNSSPLFFLNSYSQEIEKEGEKHKEAVALHTVIKKRELSK